MIAAISCLAISLLLAPQFLCAGTIVNLPLTVLVDFEAPHSETSLQSMRKGLRQILGPGGLSVDVQLKSDLPENPQFGQLVIFKMKGSCSLASPVSGPIYDERGPLAMSYTSDGEVLHFGEVECDRVRHSLQRILGMNHSLKCQQAYGSALAIVIAHEVYHMLGNVSGHTREGVTKPGLTAAELMDTKLAMPHNALAAIEGAMHSELPDH